MKKTFFLLPLACGISAMFNPALAEEQPWRVEPVVSVRHSEQGPAAWYRLGRQHQQDQRLDLAADAYGQALASDKDHIDARNALATIHAQQGRYDEAVAEFETLLQADGKLAYVHNNLGYTYLLKTDYAKAIAAFGNALAIEPGNARAGGNLALANEALARSAVATYSVAAAQEPQAVAQAEAEQPVINAVAQAATESPSLSGVAVEISNGTRDAQLGENLAQTLRREGATITRVAGLKPYNQHRNVIMYRDGFRNQALALSRSFAVPPALVKNTRGGQPDLRVVLGKSALQTVQVAADVTAQTF